MADTEENYLRRRFGEKHLPGLSAADHKKFGSGQLKDGVFCSLDSYCKWHKASMMRRHQDRVQNGGSDE